jgi:hypothetical protein
MFMHRMQLAAGAAAIVLAAAAQATPPNACTTLPPADIATVLGAGWVQTPSTMATHMADLESCSYTKGVGQMVAFSILRPPGGNAKKDVAKRQKNVAPRHKVTKLPDVCEGGFSYASTATITTLVAAKGKWEVQINVIIENKPDTASERKLIVAACERMGS